jgi:hypothetical protein
MSAGKSAAKSATYRDLAWDNLAGLVRNAAEAADLGTGLEAALDEFRIKFDAAVDAVPAVVHALDRVPVGYRPEDRASRDDAPTVDPINRADEIAAHISETFRKR